MASSFSVYKCMWPRGSSQWDVRVLGETFRRVALESRLKGPLMDLKNHLMKSISGSLLNPSGKGVRVSELTFLADSGILALASVTAHVSAPMSYPANFSSVIQSVPYRLPYFGCSILTSMGKFAGGTFVQWAGYRQIFSWTLAAGMDVITGVACTLLFCFPRFPFCRWIPAEGKQVCFVSYT